MLQWKSWEGMPKEESLEVTLENRQIGCGYNMLGETVLSKGSSNRKGQFAEGGQPCTMDSQRQWGSRAEVSLGLEISRALKFIGEVQWCCPVQIFVRKNRASFNCILSGALIQYTNKSMYKLLVTVIALFMATVVTIWGCSCLPILGFRGVKTPG